ncbi:alanine racemase [Phytohabitans rumicis]|uniref:Amino acid deaminase n=1 Tax=Phytohabitans rumicis TaxID=1076125 RepID=A0A6V8LHW0_9ACTN|nr:alanine racemase [Phytohabitans rumicis]GFJ94229.1 amino acid deaminase [Phytohabitans rumicis]
MDKIDWRTKGIWWPGPPVTPAEFAAARHDLFGGAFTWPVLVADGAAIAHNIDTLAAFCARHGLEFAPHGKTTMAPSLFEAQLRAGACAITVATANQVLACRALGVPAVLLANELVDPGPLRWVAQEVERGFDFLCYADSLAGVRAMSSAVASVPGDRPLRVLVELGHPGGRTGCRTPQELAEVARAVIAAPRLTLAGVAGYEGGLPDAPAVAAYLDGLRAAVRDLADEGLLPDPVIVTAGGSKYFDLVASKLAGSWLPGYQLRTILRSGAYISHDDGTYREQTPFRRVPGEGALEAALEIWAQVTSTPEKGLAIVGMGKREAPYDEGLPVPRKIRGLDGTARAADGLRVTAINDHHAYVEVPPDVELVPGELVAFGISHPCTAFDKWQVIPVVDPAYKVIDLIHTHF